MPFDGLPSSTWLLLGAGEDEGRTPVHGMRLAFQAEPGGGFSGAVIGWGGGERIPLAAVRFDGSTLEFRMAAPAGQSREMPTLIADRVGERFEGYWYDPANRRLGSPRLKIVRYRA
jgi:hypothetical protein